LLQTGQEFDPLSHIPAELIRQNKKFKLLHWIVTADPFDMSVWNDTSMFK